MMAYNVNIDNNVNDNKYSNSFQNKNFEEDFRGNNDFLNNANLKEISFTETCLKQI